LYFLFIDVGKYFAHKFSIRIKGIIGCQCTIGKVDVQRRIGLKKGCVKQCSEFHGIPGNQILVPKGTIAKGEADVVLDTKVDPTGNIHHLVT
jgi:hypothetical protein